MIIDTTDNTEYFLYRFNISKKDWYKIEIPHGDALEFLYFKNQFYPNIKRSFIRKLFINLSYNQI